MKKGKKLLTLALAFVCALALMATFSLPNLADAAIDVLEREYTERWDAMFEDFARSDVSNTTTIDGTGVTTGEAPYLHVAYTSATSGDAGQIYKQGSGNFNGAQSNGVFTFKMRTPDGSATLTDILFGARGVDNDDYILFRPLSELRDASGDTLPELTTEWQEISISFANSYEEDDTYPSNPDSTVPGTPLLAIHLKAASGASGQIDIASISLNGNVFMDFTGGETLADMANVKGSAWWVGSTGTVMPREISVSGTGALNVVRQETVKELLAEKVTVKDDDVIYAIVEADGAVSVATTTDGTTWSAAVAYEGPIVVDGGVKGFRITSTNGSKAVISRIWVTSLYSGVPQTAVPVIDASTADVLDDFAVDQKGFNGNYDEMITAPELEEAGLEYRLSYSNGDKVEVKNGALVFEGLASGYTNFKFKSATVSYGKYIVFKMKGEDGVDISSFRFNLVMPDGDATNSEPVWAWAFKGGLDYPARFLDATNPYNDGEWYYVVIDIEESGFNVSENGYGGVDMYYGGEKDLYIDTIFLCEKLADVDVQRTTDTKVEIADHTSEYAYGGYLYLPNEDAKAVSFEFDLTPATATFDPSNLRLEFKLGESVSIGTYWGSENVGGTLITTEGKKLNELTYTSGVATHVVIDLAASGIEGAFKDVHVHISDIDGFTIDNVVLNAKVAAEYIYEGAEEITVTVGKTVNFEPTASNYQYADGLDVTEGAYDTMEFKLTPGANFDVSGIRFEIGTIGTYWGSENQAGVLKTVDGKMLSELTYVEGTEMTIVIDLTATGVTGAFNVVHIHTNGTGTGAFTMSDFKFTAEVAGKSPYYEEQLKLLDEYLNTVKPEVTITTPTTANVGDKVTITWTASDDVTPVENLVVTVTVIKDGVSVTLAADNSFIAEEGVYTVTVKVKDGAGNEGESTIQINVTRANNNSTTTTPPAEKEPASLTWLWILLGVLGCAVVAGVVVMVIKKRK